MAYRPARPMFPRQASSVSTASSSSNPETHILTPAPGITDYHDAPGSPLWDDKLSRYDTNDTDARSVASKSRSTRNRQELSEIDRLAYTYALRVAALHHHFHPSVPISHPGSPTSVTSPQLKQRKSFIFRKTSSSANPVTSPPLPQVPSLPHNKHLPSEAKLPKEYLIELWGILAAEAGDPAWTETKRTFLSGIKKGSRNERGGNLREVPMLVETFESCIPPQIPASPLRRYFLNLVSSSLASSIHFSSSARPQSEKDRELHRRLRREVASHVFEQPLSTGPLSPTLQAESPLQSPGFISAREDISEMEETVGLIFGMSRETLIRDLTGIANEGSMIESTKGISADELLYIRHTQATITHLASLPSHTSIQRQRHAELSRELSALLRDYPQFASSLNANSFTTFFIPNRKMEVYSAMCDRAEENVTLQRRVHLLLDECVKVWHVPGEEERQKEVEGLIIGWTRSVGGSGTDEREWGRMLEEGVSDLCAGKSDQADLGVGVEQLLTTLLGMLGKSVDGMLGGGEGWGSGRNATGVNGPPVSLLPLLRAGHGFLLRRDRSIKKLAEVEDELKGTAVGEYVQAVDWLMGGVGVGSAAAEQAKGYVEVAGWIEEVVLSIQAKWGDGLGTTFDPAAIVLSKQLPLFFAELQMLDGGVGVGSDRVFGLYEITGRLGLMWDDLCPGIDHGFEIDAFFEPHVIAWLKETEASKVHEWVSRAVAMDRWTPEGDQSYSQSVVDLFEFIQQSLHVILVSLPLTPYKRSLYLADISKTAALAVSQYASTLRALFQVDLNPPVKPSNMAGELGSKLNDKITGKAGSWLAKGQQAMKTLERKRVEGFVIPAAALVKISNMSACATSLDDLATAIGPEETTRLVRTKTRGDADQAAKHPFIVAVTRGQNLLGKGQSKAADAFCIVTDIQIGERLIKTRTVLGVEDPRWDQSFEIVVTNAKQLEVAVYDRSLVGKHDLIGSTTFKLDPKSWTNSSTRDVQIPLQPRGTVHLRISLEGGSGQETDIGANLAGATRSLDRTENDMVGEVTEKMMEFLRDQLSVRTLVDMTKPKDKKKMKVYVGDAELEASLGGTTDYLNVNFGIFSQSLSPSTRLDLQLKLWYRILEHLISLLVPPLSDRPSTTAPLPSDQIEIVLKWVQLLKAFFNAREGSVEHGVTINQLQGGVYKDIMMVGQYMDLPTPTLKERASAAVKGVIARSRGSAEDGTTQAEAERMAEVLLRIVRTRQDTSDFLVQQVGALSKSRTDRHAGMLQT